MIHLKNLENPNLLSQNQKTLLEEYKDALRDRKVSLEILEKSLYENQRRKELLRKIEQLKSEQNTLGEHMVTPKQEGEKRESTLNQLKHLSHQVKKLKEQLEEIKTSLHKSLSYLPNLCHESVPPGSLETDNLCVRKGGEIPKKDFEMKEHWRVADEKAGLEFIRAAKVSGSRFVFLKNHLAKMERVLIQFMLDVHTKEHGYEEIAPPFIVNSKSLYNSGHFPKFTEDVFSLSSTNYHLIPTAEVPLTNYHSEEILREEELPKAYVSYTPCFRSEAGSYGKDTKGLIRQHQFNKVELFLLSHPKKSFEILETLTSQAENIIKKLKLPYRVMSLCRGELGFSAAKGYDLELWFPGQKKYLEISSCSNCLDFQARRSQIRFRSSSSSSLQFVHTLNGSGLAIGRTLMSIIENYQQKDGRVEVPDILKEKMGCDFLF